MKKAKKVLVTAAAAALCVGACLSLAACGEKAPTVKDVYTVEPGSTGTARYATVPMGLVETNVETITVYSDSTYRFKVSTTIVTGLGAITNNEGTVINRGQTILEYYGKYTQTVDSGVTVLKLATPTRMTIANTNELLTGGLPIGYFDTAAWTGGNTETFSEWYGGAMVNGEGDATGENILKKFAYAETEVVISESNTFEYVRASYHNIVLSAMGF